MYSVINNIKEKGFVVIDNPEAKIDLSHYTLNQMSVPITHWHIDFCLPLLGIYKLKGAIRNSTTQLSYCSLSNKWEKVEPTSSIIDINWDVVEESKLLIFCNAPLSTENGAYKFLIHRGNPETTEIKNVGNLFSVILSQHYGEFYNRALDFIRQK